MGTYKEKMKNLEVLAENPKDEQEEFMPSEQIKHGQERGSNWGLLEAQDGTDTEEQKKPADRHFRIRPYRSCAHGFESADPPLQSFRRTNPDSRSRSFLQISLRLCEESAAFSSLSSNLWLAVLSGMPAVESLALLS